MAAIRTSTRRASRAPARRGDAVRIDEDRVLFERLADEGDPIDRELLVERFLPLARSLAARYVRHGELFDDVFQVACLGLLKAIDRFDISRGRAFSSFAVPTIAGEIKRYYRDKTWGVHVPRDLQDLALRVDRERHVLETDLSRSPTVAELAERVGVDDEDVVEALQAHEARRSTSFETPYDADDASRTIGETAGTIEPGYEMAEARADLSRLSRVLTGRERVVLRLRFAEDLTQQEIGERIGVSQMQVSRILRSSLGKLRSQTQHQDGALASGGRGALVA
jgi:RNA polymerase sigma-B factor